MPGAIIMTISKDRVRPSPHPERWNLIQIFVTGSILGGYLAMMTVIFFWTAYQTDFFPVMWFIFCVIMSPNSGVMYARFPWFNIIENNICLYIVFNKLDWNSLCNIQRTFGVSSLNEKDVDNWRKLVSAVYLQVSSISQAHLFVTRARSWSYVECPVLFLALAFFVAQLVSDLCCFLSPFWHTEDGLILFNSVSRLLHWLPSMQPGALLQLKE